LGFILPGASSAIKATQTGMVGVLGTAMTIQSYIYRQKIQAISPETQVDSLASPKFEQLVESNSHQTSLAKKLVYETL
ncbi:glutamate racemase, partial [Streptococcus suis]